MAACDDLVLDSTLHTGGGGRPLDLVWSYSPSTLLDASPLSRNSSEILAEASRMDSERVIVPGSWLVETSSPYTFHLSARNFLGNEYLTQVSVNRLADRPPRSVFEQNIALSHGYVGERITLNV